VRDGILAQGMTTIAVNRLGHEAWGWTDGAALFVSDLLTFARIVGGVFRPMEFHPQETALDRKTGRSISGKEHHGSRW